MSWFKVDDKLWGHPKWLAVPARARGLWVTAGSWSAERATDGLIPREALRALGGTTKDAEALVKAGLWHEEPTGWRFHEWTVYQPDAASEKARRKAESDAGALGNHRRWHVARGTIVADCEYCQWTPPIQDTPPPDDEYRVPDRVPDQGGIGFVSPVPVPDIGTRLDMGGSPKQANAKACPHGRPEGAPCGACADARRQQEAAIADAERARHQSRRRAEAVEAAEREAEAQATLAIDLDTRRQAAEAAKATVRAALTSPPEKRHA